MIITRSKTRAMEADDLFRKFKAEGESLGLSGLDLVSYVKEEKRHQTEAEERRHQTEAEERRRQTEAEERKRQAEMEYELELERIRTNVNNINDNAVNPMCATSSHGNHEKLKIKLPFFEDKDNLEDYLRTFERTAKIQEWPDEQWAPRLGTLLKGKAREVYSMLNDTDAADYRELRRSLLQRFQLTAEEYRKKFRDAIRQQGEPTQEYATKLDMWLSRWQELAGKEDTYSDLRDLILQEKFLGGIPFDQARFVREREPDNMDTAVRFALTYESAKIATMSDHSKPKNKFENRSQQNERKVEEVKRRNEGAQQQPLPNRGRNPNATCYTCNQQGHLARHCPKGRMYNKTAAAAVENTRQAKVQSHGKLCTVCTAIPFSPECHVEVEGKKATALRDTGASITIVKTSLVPERCLSGETVEIVMASSLEKMSLPIAIVHLNTPFFEGKTKVAVMEQPVEQVLLGNYCNFEDGTLIPIPVYPIREICATVETKTSAEKEKKPLKTSSSILGNVTPAELSQAQKEDPTLEKARKLADSGNTCKSRGRKTVSSATYSWRKGILYRTFLKNGKDTKQVVVPKKFRSEVLRLAHDTPMSGHLGVTKTRQKIWSDFVWPGICGDIRRYCASCDVCQRTSPRGKVRKLPLGKMPIIHTPFDRVAVDIIGPIIPSSERGHRYIITMVDYATRYVEAKPLKSIKAEDVAEALWEIWTRLGIPREILTDNGSQFVGSLANEVNRLLSVRGLRTTPRHAQCNGLVERFNGTIKNMLRHLCQEQPREWDRFIPALLFAIREVPQESLQFSPFELLYGRTVRGPIQILKELWTKEKQTEETRTTFQYVIDLRNRIEETCEIARENLEKASVKHAKHFNKKAKARKFEVGDKVLMLVSDKANKLQMLWKGPYVVVDRINQCDYKIAVGDHERIYHANILKLYVEREKQVETHIVAVVMIDEYEQDNTGTKDSIPVVQLQNTQGPDDIHLSDQLTGRQKTELREICSYRKSVLTDLPGQTFLQECNFTLEQDNAVFVRQYPLPYSKVKTIGEEVDAMLKLGVIESATSPYSAPVVLVQKKDGSNRFCIDYRKLNQVTKFDAEPMPDINELFAKLNKRKYFSKIDLAKGYWQIPMKEEDKEKTAFTTPQGQFQWTVMPFGLKNAGAVFSRMMRKLLRPLDRDAVSNFIDDIMIATYTWEEHIQVLKATLDRLEECGLTAKPSKCYLGFEKLSFLGHIVGQGTIQPEEDKVDKIRDAQPPKTKKDLRAFLGLAGYYRKFVQNFATIALPLTEKTKKGHPENVQWDDDCEEAFTLLKNELCKKPVICLPDSEKQYTLRTDASDRGIGAVLMQDQGNGLQPIAYASKKLSETEGRYAIIEKECMAIVWGVRKFEQYLFGTKFVIETDHQPLQYLQKARTENGRLMRWAIQLQQYNFTVRVIPGKDNIGADYLSRSM